MACGCKKNKPVQAIDAHIAVTTGNTINTVQEEQEKLINNIIDKVNAINKQ